MPGRSEKYVPSRFGQNIKALRESRGITQPEFAKSIGVSLTSVSSWETRGVPPRRPSEGEKGPLQTIYELYGVTEVDLFGYSDGLWAQMHGGSREETANVVGLGKEVNLVLSAESSDGISDKAEGIVEIPSAVAAAHPGAFACQMGDDSMDRRFPKGSLLLVDPNMEVLDGDAILADLPREGTVLRVIKRGGTGTLFCPDSASKLYRDVYYDASEGRVSIRGVVVWYQAASDVRRPAERKEG